MHIAHYNEYNGGGKGKNKWMKMLESKLLWPAEIQLNTHCDIVFVSVYVCVYVSIWWHWGVFHLDIINSTMSFKLCFKWYGVVYLMTKTGHYINIHKTKSEILDLQKNFLCVRLVKIAYHFKELLK